MCAVNERLVRRINFVLCFVAAIHLTAATIYDILGVPRRKSKALEWGGKLIFMTVWNGCIEAIYFCYAVFENIVSGCTDNEKKPLRQIRDFWFISIVFPLSGFVSLTFWALWAIDRELVMPKAVDPYFPSWLNHSVHTLILAYSLLELGTTYHKTLTPFSKHCLGLWPVTVSYLAWCVYVWHKSGMWVYPILDQLNWPGRILFFGASLAASTGFLGFGYYLNNIVWKKKVQGVSKKKLK